jgi:hypothetical protein
VDASVGIPEMSIDDHSDGDCNDLLMSEMMYGLYQATIDPAYVRYHEAACHPSIITSQALKAQGSANSCTSIDNTRPSQQIGKVAEVIVYLAKLARTP